MKSHAASARSEDAKAPRAGTRAPSRGRDEEARVPWAGARGDAGPRGAKAGTDRAARPGAERFDSKAPRGATRFDKAEPRSYQDRQAEERQARKDAGPSRGKPGDVVTLWVGAGSQSGIRPGDLVGAIANEAGLHSKQIGPIEIKEGYSLVGVPTVAVEAVIDALESSGLRGRKVKVRREKN